VATNNITGKRYIDHWREAGFECETAIKNTGAGAAMMRVEAARRIFPRCWFNEKPTEAGRDALGYYHERCDENRNVGLVRNMTGRVMLRSAAHISAVAISCCRSPTVIWRRRSIVVPAAFANCWLDGRDVLILKPDRQEPLAGCRGRQRLPD